MTSEFDEYVKRIPSMTNQEIEDFIFEKSKDPNVDPEFFKKITNPTLYFNPYSIKYLSIMFLYAIIQVFIIMIVFFWIYIPVFVYIFFKYNDRSIVYRFSRSFYWPMKVLANLSGVRLLIPEVFHNTF